MVLWEAASKAFASPTAKCDPSFHRMSWAEVPLLRGTTVLEVVVQKQQNLMIGVRSGIQVNHAKRHLCEYLDVVWQIPAGQHRTAYNTWQLAFENGPFPVVRLEFLVYVLQAHLYGVNVLKTQHDTAISQGMMSLSCRRYLKPSIHSTFNNNNNKYNNFTLIETLNIELTAPQCIVQFLTIIIKQ